MIVLIHQGRVVGVNKGSGYFFDEGGVQMEVIPETREDPLEEVAEISLPTKVGYEWVATYMRTQHSLFRWSWLLSSWLKCIPIFEKGISLDIVSLERVSVVECVCHGQGDAEEGFFYVNMCHFS